VLAPDQMCWSRVVLVELPGRSVVGTPCYNLLDVLWFDIHRGCSDHSILRWEKAGRPEPYWTGAAHADVQLLERLRVLRLNMYIVYTVEYGKFISRHICKL